MLFVFLFFFVGFFFSSLLSFWFALYYLVLCFFLFFSLHLRVFQNYTKKRCIIVFSKIIALLNNSSAVSTAVSGFSSVFLWIFCSKKFRNLA